MYIGGLYWCQISVLYIGVACVYLHCLLYIGIVYWYIMSMYINAACGADVYGNKG